MAVLAEKKVARHHCLGLQIMIGVAGQTAAEAVLARALGFHTKMTCWEETLVSCRDMRKRFRPALPRCHIDADSYWTTSDLKVKRTSSVRNFGNRCLKW